MLYQRVTGDFYTINSEGKFTLPRHKLGIAANLAAWYHEVRQEGRDAAYAEAGNQAEQE